MKNNKKEANNDSSDNKLKIHNDFYTEGCNTYNENLIYKAINTNLIAGIISTSTINTTTNTSVITSTTTTNKIFTSIIDTIEKNATKASDTKSIAPTVTDVFDKIAEVKVTKTNDKNEKQLQEQITESKLTSSQIAHSPHINKQNENTDKLTEHCLQSHEQQEKFNQVDHTHLARIETQQLQQQKQVQQQAVIEEIQIKPNEQQQQQRYHYCEHIFQKQYEQYDISKLHTSQKNIYEEQKLFEQSHKHDQHLQHHLQQIRAACNRQRNYQGRLFMTSDPLHANMIDKHATDTVNIADSSIDDLIVDEDLFNLQTDDSSNMGLTSIKGASKERKKHDRFNGIPEEEVVKRILPDHICDNLDIVIVGINPGLFAAYKGHHYAGPGNHFWKCLYMSGLTQEQMSAEEDYKLIEYGIGFTNMVQRATKGSADLTRKEIKEGSRILLEKLQRFRPKIAVFNGKLIFEVFSGRKDFNFGRQPECVEGTNTYIWVMPSSSARCAQLPRAADKVPFYAALKKFRDFLKGLIPYMDESEWVFTEQRIKQVCDEQKERKRELQRNVTTKSDNDQPILNFQNTNINSNPLKREQHEKPQKKFTSAHPYLHSEDNNGGIHEINNAEQISGIVLSDVAPVILPQYSQKSMQEIQHLNMLNTYNAQNQHVPLMQQKTILPEKKKRGRPKKINSFVNLITEQKLQPNNINNINNNNNYEILNLSMVDNANGVELKIGETPRKKRGRPKKLKLTAEILHQSEQPANSFICQQQNKKKIEHEQESNIISTDIILPGLDKIQEQSPSHRDFLLYESPSPSHNHIKQHMYMNISPMHSPSVKFSYNTKPNGGCSSNSRTTSQASSNVNNMNVFANTPKNNNSNPSHHYYRSVDKPPVSSSESHFGKSSPPSSPNMCTMGFDSPDATRSTMLPPSNKQQQSNKNVRNQSQDDYHQQHQTTVWLSPQQANYNQQQNTAISVDYHEQEQLDYMQNLNQLHELQQRHHTSSPLHSLWQSQQSHEENVSSHQHLTEIGSYLTHNAHHQYYHQQRSAHTTNQHSHSSAQVSNDMTNKSLSGLESLVDQIPTITETATGSLTPAGKIKTCFQQQQQMQQQQQSDQNILLKVNEFNSENFASTTANEATIDSVNGARGNNVPHTLCTPHNLTTFNRTSRGCDPPKINSVIISNHANSNGVSDTSSPIYMSPHHHYQYQQQQEQQQYTVSHLMINMQSPVTLRSSSSTDATTITDIEQANSTTFGIPSPNNFASLSNQHKTKFSVDKLVNPQNTNNNSIVDHNRRESYPTEDITNNATAYHHHPNLLTTALATVTTSTPVNDSYAPHAPRSQIYMDAHISPHHHVPVSSMYTPTSIVPHSHHTHHHYGTTTAVQHNSQNCNAGVIDITNPGFCVSDVTTSSNSYNPVTIPAASLLHSLPSSNYAYTYSAPNSTGIQNNYMIMHAAVTASSTLPPSPLQGYTPQISIPSITSSTTEQQVAILSSGTVSSDAEAATIVVDYHKHYQHHVFDQAEHLTHPHHSHHPLSVYERFKHSELGSYSGFLCQP